MHLSICGTTATNQLISFYYYYYYYLALLWWKRQKVLTTAPTSIRISLHYDKDADDDDYHRRGKCLQGSFRFRFLCAVLIISAEAVSFIYCIMREVFWRRKSAKWMV